MILGVFTSAPLMAVESPHVEVRTYSTEPTAVYATNANQTYLQMLGSQSLTDDHVAKILDFASKLYNTKLEKLGFVCNLKKSVDEQCEEVKKYAKNIAKQLGISEDDFNILFRETETLLRQTSISNADERLKDLLVVCLRVSSVKIEKRLEDAGIDPLLQELVGMIAVQSLEVIASKTSNNGCCGKTTRTLLDVVQEVQASKEPIN